MSCHTWMTRSCRTDKGLKLLIDPPLPGGAEEVGAAALRHVLGVQLQQPLHAGGAHLGGAETQAASLPDGKGGAQAQAPQDAGGGQELGGESVGRALLGAVLVRLRAAHCVAPGGAVPQREVADLVRDGEAPAALALLGPVEDGRQRPVLLSEQEAVRPVDMLGQVVPAQELIPLDRKSHV